MTSHFSTESKQILILTLNDPLRLNAMSPELGAQLASKVVEYKKKANLRAVVICGAGGAFSSGGDLGMLRQLVGMKFDEAYAFMRSFYARYLSILDFQVPVIAAVQGVCVGAGLGLALACDFIVADKEAKMALNFVSLGIHPGMGTSYTVKRRVGLARASELMYTACKFSGAHAFDIGLVNHAVPSEDVLPKALELAVAVASQSPFAVGKLKKTMGWSKTELDEALDIEATEQAECYVSPDFSEGLSAALEKRKPVFDGGE